MSEMARGTMQDRKSIALNGDDDVRDWCKSLGCTEEQLRVALQAVGRSVDKVSDYLRSNWTVAREDREAPAKANRAAPRTI